MARRRTSVRSVGPYCFHVYMCTSRKLAGFKLHSPRSTCATSCSTLVSVPSPCAILSRCSRSPRVWGLRAKRCTTRGRNADDGLAGRLVSATIAAARAPRCLQHHSQRYRRSTSSSLPPSSYRGCLRSATLAPSLLLSCCTVSRAATDPRQSIRPSLLHSRATSVAAGTLDSENGKLRSYSFDRTSNVCEQLPSQWADELSTNQKPGTYPLLSPTDGEYYRHTGVTLNRFKNLVSYSSRKRGNCEWNRTMMLH